LHGGSDFREILDSTNWKFILAAKGGKPWNLKNIQLVLPVGNSFALLLTPLLMVIQWTHPERVSVGGKTLEGMA